MAFGWFGVLDEGACWKGLDGIEITLCWGRDQQQTANTLQKSRDKVEMKSTCLPPPPPPSPFPLPLVRHL